MSITSLPFILIFIPLFVLLMLAVKNNEARNLIILVFSLLFYGLYDVSLLCLLLLVSLLTYLFSLFVKGNKSLYILYLLLIISILCFFKYQGLLNKLFTSLEFANILFPLGISFYTFTSVGYISDCYRNKYPADKNIIHVLLFMTFFPTITSGPILRYDSFCNYLKRKEINTSTINNGCRKFIYGLFKKVFLANQLAIISDVVFSGNSNLSFLLSWYGVISYMMQIYLDFSGYSDMAIGIAEMIGFSIPDNFNYPYVSVNPQDFWRRWHISLSMWFRDYVYIPLGGNRVSNYRWILNMMTVWILTGIWHGSTFNYVLWGLYNGLVLIAYRKSSIKCNNFLGWVFTMLFVMVGWVIFNTQSLHQTLTIFKAMAGMGANLNLNYIYSLDILYLIPIFFLSFICCFPVIKSCLNRLEKFSPLANNFLLLILLTLSLYFIVIGSYNSFIYANF